MVSFKDIHGLKIVGFRYGKAPYGGRSYNTREREYEPGVSMAKVGYGKEIRSFAVDGQSKKKYYYEGLVAGTGGDDEICLKNVREITRAEYDKKLKDTVYVSNLIIDYYADRKKNLKDRGFDIGMTYEEIEKFRNKYKKAMELPKAKFRIGQLVTVPHDQNKHKVKSKRLDRGKYWQYHVTGISGEFPEDWLKKPTKELRKKWEKFR